MRINEDVDPHMVGREYRDCAKGAHMTPVAPPEPPEPPERLCVNCEFPESDHVVYLILGELAGADETEIQDGRRVIACPAQMEDVEVEVFEAV